MIFSYQFNLVILTFSFSTNIDLNLIKSLRDEKKIQLINGIIMYIKLLGKACYNAFVYKTKKSKNKTKNC